MMIHCLGVSHNTANVNLRERLAFNPHQLEAALARVGCGSEDLWKSIQELVILSTCNRTEIYAVADEQIFDILELFLSQAKGISAADFSHAAYKLLNDAAVDHLMRVSAGLDSLVLGEPQVLGQVTEAYSGARQQGLAGKILSRLFQTAIRAGKRTRTETAIGQNPGSISSVAVRLIASALPDLKASRILVIGAGEMAELAVNALQKRGVMHVTVANRTLERARSLSDLWDGRAATLESLPELLAEADVVITSTGAPHTIIGKLLVESAMKNRPNRPLVIMDIALPRDVDVEVGQIPNVRRFDMDALGSHLKISIAKRKAEVPAVEEILVEEQENFRAFLATLDVVPIIKEMRQQANDIREAELAKALRRMPELSLEAQELIHLATQAIVNKILHNPTIGLRKAAENSKTPEYAEIARELFGLNEPGK